jgi:uncharacterized protein
MSKILLWVAIVLVALVGLRLLNVAKAKRRTARPDTGTRRSPPGEAMVRCARCGVYLPRAEATSGPAGPTCGDPRCKQLQ